MSKENAQVQVQENAQGSTLTPAQAALETKRVLALEDAQKLAALEKVLREDFTPAGLSQLTRHGLDCAEELARQLSSVISAERANRIAEQTRRWKVARAYLALKEVDESAAEAFRQQHGLTEQDIAAAKPAAGPTRRRESNGNSNGNGHKYILYENGNARWTNSRAAWEVFRGMLKSREDWRTRYRVPEKKDAYFLQNFLSEVCGLPGVPAVDTEFTAAGNRYKFAIVQES